MSPADEISAAAAEWLIRLEGQTTTQVWAAFETWAEADPRHRAAFIRFREAWHRADGLKALRPADGLVDARLLDDWKMRPLRWLVALVRGETNTPRRHPEDGLMPNRRSVAAGAVLIAAAGLAAWFASWHLGWKTYTTGVGGREKVELADGSTVDLNTNSELTVRMLHGRREAMLTRGEALFHVAHDPTRAFYVTAGETVVRALGTDFDVRIRDSSQVDVLVETGRVAVGAPQTEANFDNPSLLASAPKVSTGELATVHRRQVDVHPMAAVDAWRKLAWTAGHVAFQDEPLERVVGEFNRYNQRQILVADPALLSTRVRGCFVTSDIDSFAAALHQSLGIQVQRADRRGDLRLTTQSGEAGLR